jgi:hypothetical protein
MSVLNERERATIVLVAMPESIHTARWAKQIAGQGWKIHLFPSIRGGGFHPELSGVVAHYWFHTQHLEENRPARKFTALVNKAFSYIRVSAVDPLFPDYRAKQLARLVAKLQPQLVHSLEFQAAGYLTLRAKQILSGQFPRWIATNWGSDIYLFGRLRQHREKIREVLSNCDYYSCECDRDIALAREFGFQGTSFPAFPNSGGFALDGLKEIRKTRTSKRTLIMLKGYQHFAGRALVGLRALERCADVLRGYEIGIYSAPADVVLAAELFTARHGIPTRIIPRNTPHRDMLALHGLARVSIGLSIGDAISTSLLEAMVMGSFPVQSGTACANEWIEHGVSGMIVPPEDPDIIEAAIRTALVDDDLVDQAADINWQIARARLNSALLKQKAIDMYSSALKGI